MISFIKCALRLVLHLQKLADTVFVPTKVAQIVTATALINLKQKVVVFWGCPPQRN
jgi:hypothetical protein